MYFATDLANFLACRHITTLDRAADAGEISRDSYDDPGLKLLKELGLRHEQAYFSELQSEGRTVVTIPTENSPWSDAADLTREAMRQGVDVIYQATFMDGDWGGRADFLVRVATASALGDWSYEAVETKLAHSTKARALIQLCLYSELITTIQSREPNSMHVVLGGGAASKQFAVQRYLAFFRKIRRDFEAAILAKSETYPEPIEHCAICDWYRVCNDRWHNDDHLALVAYVTRNQREALIEREVDTVEKLAVLSLPIAPKIERIALTPLLRIREQARVQIEGRVQGKPVFEFILPNETDEAKRERRSGKGADAPKKAEALRGFAALPAPSPGDLFLDLEGDPFAFDQGLEYLVGTVTIADDGTPTYEPVWSFDPKSEKQAFIQLIERIKQIRVEHPNMHIYHYAPYEPTGIKHLSGRHGVCADDVDELLRAGVFVDLFRVVRQGLRASVESYSIKKMEEFYGFRRTVDLRTATSSLQAFETVLALGDKPEEAKEILDTIAGYNRDDCLSTWQLRDWLEELRSQLEGELGQKLERPELKSGAPSEDLEAELIEIAA